MNGKLWPLIVGFSLWGLAFVALYGVQALGCIWGWPEAAHRGVLLAIWGATLALLGLYLLWQWKREARASSTVQRIGLVCTSAAIAATIASYFPMMFVSLCI